MLKTTLGFMHQQEENNRGFSNSRKDELFPNMQYNE
jgi:hypothetical protein